jgi:hypothetical protein
MLLVKPLTFLLDSKKVLFGIKDCRLSSQSTKERFDGVRSWKDRNLLIECYLPNRDSYRLPEWQTPSVLLCIKGKKPFNVRAKFPEIIKVDEQPLIQFLLLSTTIGGRVCFDLNNEVHIELKNEILTWRKIK